MPIVRPLIILALVAAGCSSQTSPPRTVSLPATVSAADAMRDQAVFERLRRFQAIVLKDTLDDEAIAAERQALSRDISDDQLVVAERYAMTAEAKPIAFPLAHLFVTRGRMDAAAEAIVTGLLDRPENREYGLWKWWEHSFIDKPNYEQMSHDIGEALFRQFAKGPQARRRVVADVFGKGEAETSLTVEQFRTAVMGPATRP